MKFYLKHIFIGLTLLCIIVACLRLDTYESTATGGSWTPLGAKFEWAIDNNRLSGLLGETLIQGNVLAHRVYERSDVPILTCISQYAAFIIMTFLSCLLFGGIFVGLFGVTVWFLGQIKLTRS